jgi:hypothetical protein
MSGEVELTSASLYPTTRGMSLDPEHQPRREAPDAGEPVDAMQAGNDLILRMRAYRRRELFSRIAGTVCLLVLAPPALYVAHNVVDDGRSRHSLSPRRRANGRLRGIAYAIALAISAGIAGVVTVVLRPKGHPPED